MRHFLVPRSARLVLALGIAAAVAAPAAADAAGFSQPVAISGHDDVDSAQSVIAPNGRTAVLYEREARRGRRDGSEFRVAIGPSPDQLGRPKTIKDSWRPARHYGGANLLARPDGGFVLCFVDYARHHGAYGCRIAQPSASFGELQLLRPLGRRKDPSIDIAVRPDSSLVLLLNTTRATADGRLLSQSSWVSSLSATGVVGGARRLERTKDERQYTSNTPIVVADDGTVAIPAAVPLTGERGGSQPAIRLMAPGSNQFGPVIPLSTDRVEGYLDLTGGAVLSATYETAASSAPAAPYQERVIRRLPDGSFSQALGLPGSQDESAFGPVVPLPDGNLLAITGLVQTDPEDSDCFNPIAGEVGSGPLGLPGQTTAAVRLSAPGQIALGQQAGVVSDGTVIASWEDAISAYGDSRIEVALRAPGAVGFAAPQVLPKPARLYGSQLATGGNQAALVWISVGAPHTNASKLWVSTLRTSPPYAKQAPLPRHPAANCDE